MNLVSLCRKWPTESSSGSDEQSFSAANSSEPDLPLRRYKSICLLSKGGLQAVAELLQVDCEMFGLTSDHYSITLRRYAGMALTNLTFGDVANKVGGNKNRTH